MDVAEDFGDDSGDKLLEWSMRMVMEKGRRGAYKESSRFSDALRSAREQLDGMGDAGKGEAGPVMGHDGWAKLDMHEFCDIEGWEELKSVLDGQLEAKGLAHEWFEDEQAGKTYLLFQAGDARELSNAFGELEERVSEAHERAIAAIEKARGLEHARDDPGREQGKAERGRDDPRKKVPLREKARAARGHAAELAHGGRDGRSIEREAQRERGSR